MSDVASESEPEAGPETSPHETPASVGGIAAQAIPDRLVFDTEPLVAHATDESGESTVGVFLDAVRNGDTAGFINQVNLTETRYVIARVSGRETADQYINWLFDIGIRPVGVNDIWIDASDVILEHNPALGDSFALATADHTDASLLIGGDDDFDTVTEIPLIRFRDGPG